MQGDPFGGSTRAGPLLKLTMGYSTNCALNTSGQQLRWGNLARQPL